MRMPRLTYANVVSTLALFIALGGVSYGAIKLPANSVGTSQLRDGAVTQRKLGFPIAMASAGLGGFRAVGSPLSASCFSGGVACSPPPPVPTSLAQVTLHLSSAGNVLLLGTAEVYEPHAKAESSISIGTSFEGEGFAGQTDARLTPSNNYFQKVAFQAVVPCKSGTRRFGLAAAGYTAAETFVDGVQLVAVALPGS